MGEKLQLDIKIITGKTARIEILKSASVLELKKLVEQTFQNAPPHRQKLIVDYNRQGTGTILDDKKSLSSYSTIRNYTNIFLVIKTAYIVYVQDPDGRIHEIDVPAIEPKAFTISELKATVENITHKSLHEFQFQFQGSPVEESNHGKKLTLSDCNIKERDTVVLMKTGTLLDITKPEVDLCFLVDCTGSMGAWIEAVKNNLKAVHSQLDAQYKGCDLKVSFVRYTDYDQPETTRTTRLDFTYSHESFQKFVTAIGTPGGVGGDTAEDIMGGLKCALTQLSWRHSTIKVLIHITDAPCHGSMYHNGVDDNNPDGDKYGITHQQMMKKLADLDIQYWFGYIKREETDKMIDIFSESLQSLSKHRLIIRQFGATDLSQLRDAIHKSITASIFGAEAKRLALGNVSTAPINWAIISEKRGIKTAPPGPKTLEHLQAGLHLDNPSVPFHIKIGPTPFCEGEESLIYRGYDPRSNRHYVLKQFKADDRKKLECYMKILEIQTIASTYARDFSNNKKRPSHLEPVELINVDIADISGDLYVLQPFTDGKFEKYNTNHGIVCMTSPQSDMMQAFSHFTYVHSGESLLICDLEGARNGRGIQLTDPAIHCRLRPNKFGYPDLGFVGIKRFFRSHECNSVCRSMGLETVRI